MEIHSVTYHGWRNGLQTVEKRVTYNYEKGNDVTVVERRSYEVILYDSKAKMIEDVKGTNIDKMV